MSYHASESYRRRLMSLFLYFVLRISTANDLPCMLILLERSRLRSVSDFCHVNVYKGILLMNTRAHRQKDTTQIDCMFAAYSFLNR